MKASSWAVLCFQAAQAANQTRNARAHIKPSKRWWEFLPVSPNPWHFIQAPDSILLSKIDYQILICRYKGWILIVIPAQKEGDPVGPCGGFCSPQTCPSPPACEAEIPWASTSSLWAFGERGQCVGTISCQGSSCQMLWVSVWLLLTGTGVWAIM